MAILIAIAPFAFVFGTVFIIADFITSHFLAMSAVYFIVAALIALIIAIITEIKTVNRILDFSGVLLMFLTFYYFSFFCYVPRIINQEGLMAIVGWIFVSFIFGSLFMILYYLKKIIIKPMLWFVMRLLVSFCFIIYCIFAK